MYLPWMGRLGRYFTAMLLGLTFLSSARAGSDGESVADFTAGFLQRYPQFRAEGTMTSSLIGKLPYRCKVSIVFLKGESVLFSYNTDGVKNIIPYDFAYKDHNVKETIFVRDRTQIQQTDMLGAPTRTLFNFVWDLLYEAEHGAGIHSLLFNGLMSVTRQELGKGTKITMDRRIPAGPVEKVVFTFDGDQKLRMIDILQGDGSSHRIELRRFRAEPAKTEASH